MLKIIRIFLIFFFIEEYQLRGMFFVIAIFWLLNLECTLIYQKSFFMKSAIYHSIKLPFDVEVNKNSKMVSSVHYMWYVCEVKVDSITALLCLITYVQGGEKNWTYLAN